MNPGYLLSTPTERPCVLTSVQRPWCLTSAACDRGVQAGALCDVDLDHLLGTGRVDAYCLQQVGICRSTPETHTNTQRGHSCCFYSHSLMTTAWVIYYPLTSYVISSNNSLHISLTSIWGASYFETKVVSAEDLRKDPARNCICVV